jgi:hypothetical protein
MWVAFVGVDHVEMVSLETTSVFGLCDEGYQILHAR